MNKKGAAVAAGFVVAVLLQTSLMPHFGAFGRGWFEWINFTTLGVAIIVLFERRRHNFSWLAAVWGGLWLDIYSAHFFGFWTIVLIALVFAVKFGIKKYVRIPWYW